MYRTYFSSKGLFGIQGGYAGGKIICLFGRMSSHVHAGAGGSEKGKTATHSNRLIKKYPGKCWRNRVRGQGQQESTFVDDAVAWVTWGEPPQCPARDTAPLEWGVLPPRSQEEMPGGQLAKPDSQVGFIFSQACLCQSVDCKQRFAAWKLGKTGLFSLSLPGSFIHASSLFSPVHFSLTLSFMLARSFSFFLAVFLAPSPFGGCEHYP